MSAEAAFKAADKDNNGSLSKEEVAEVLKGLGKDPAKAAEALKKFDTNNDGKLTLDEFKKFYASQ